MSASRMNAERITLAGLAPLPCWVAWQTQLRKSDDKKPTKLPYAPGGPDSRKARANEPATWGIRSAAEARAERLPRPFGVGGVGLEFCPLNDGRHVAGIDLDACRDPATGIIADWAQSVIDRFASYCEVSPSGTGVKVFFLYAGADQSSLRSALGTTVDGKPKHSALWARKSDADHPPAIELHLSNRYFAVTDNILVGSTDEMREVPTADILQLIRVDGPGFLLDHDAEPDTATPATERKPKRTATGNMDKSRSALAFRVGGAARRNGADYEAMCDALRQHPDTADWYVEKGTANNSRELKRIWEKTNPDTGELILSGGSPLGSARQFIRRRHTNNEIRTLHHQNGTFYSWSQSHYVERPPEEMARASERYGVLS